jgi:hypothetical protein
MKVGTTSRWALALIFSFLALGVWLEGADVRRDASLYAELAAAPFSRFDESFYLGAPGDGRIRLLPLEELSARTRALEYIADRKEALEELGEHLLHPDRESKQALNGAFLLAEQEAGLALVGSAASDRHRQAFGALLTPDGRELFESLIHRTPVAQRAIIDDRDEVFARRITEVVHQLEASLGGGDFSVFVFIGAGHVPGVTRRVREALGIDTDGEPLDLGAAVSRALARIDQEAEASVRSQFYELANDGIVDVDVGPVRIRGDVHSPYLGMARMMESRSFAALVTVAEKEYPRSIQRYASIVTEVRLAARQGQHIVFFAELDALLLVDSLAELHLSDRFQDFKGSLAFHPLRKGPAYEGLDLEAETVRLFPFFHYGPVGLLFAKLDEQTIPAPFLRARDAMEE